jgi:hypothetical protein
MAAFRWTTQRMDFLERAVREKRRVAIVRRGTEFVVIAQSITSVKARDAFVGRLPMTGEDMTFILDELDGFAIVD